MFALRELQRDLQMFLDNIKLRIEKILKFTKKLFCSCSLRFVWKKAKLVHNMTLKKKFEKQKKIKEPETWNMKA